MYLNKINDDNDNDIKGYSDSQENGNAIHGAGHNICTYYGNASQHMMYKDVVDLSHEEDDDDNDNKDMISMAKIKEKMIQQQQQHQLRILQLNTDGLSSDSALP